VTVGFRHSVTGGLWPASKGLFPEPSVVVEDIEDAVRVLRTGTPAEKQDLAGRWRRCDRPDLEKIRVLALGAADDDEAVATAALAALQQVDRQVGIALLKMLTGKDQSEVRAGSNGLLALGERARPCGDALAVALQRTARASQSARREQVTAFEADAHHVLRVLRPAGSVCLEVLLDLGSTGNLDRPSRQEAVLTLDKLAAESGECRVAMLQYVELGLDRPELRLVCLGLVRHYGTSARPLRPKLQMLMNDGDAEVRAAARSALAAVPD
jgi:hypothetical protein